MEKIADLESLTKKGVIVMELSLNTKKKYAQKIDFQKLLQSKTQKEIDNINDKITKIMHEDVHDYTCWDPDIAVEKDTFELENIVTLDKKNIGEMTIMDLELFDAICILTDQDDEKSQELIKEIEKEATIIS
ncbi:hypothetical protein ACSVDA_21375 [Cytobacillus sp. Hm23]